MIDISTTATFDRLFDKLPKTIQRKAATKTDLFQANPFHPSLHAEKLHPKHQKYGASELTEPIASSSSLCVRIMQNSATSAITTPSTTTICSGK